MDRLTVKVFPNDKDYVLKCMCSFARNGEVDDLDGCKDFCSLREGKCDGCGFEEAFNRLAAYEDTGLTPEEIIVMREAMKSGGKGVIERDLELAQLMVKDLEKLWKSYAKKAQAAKEERERRQEKKGFLEYDTLEQLIDAYGWGYIDEETYNRGREYFEKPKPPEQSIIETHRSRIKEFVSRYKGTIIELEEELNPPEKKQEENAFERRERELREDQAVARAAEDKLNELFGERRHR